MNTKVLVTGANGFVGRSLCGALVGRSEVRGALRNPAECHAPEGVQCIAGDLSAKFDWTSALIGINAIVHCAARVHVMNEESTDPLAEFRAVNVAGTLSLARQAAEAGVRRFIFISSIKVNGEWTSPSCAFTPDQIPAPVDPYGISKMEAEQRLIDLAAETEMDVVIIRPPLVYGPGVKANFLAMMRLLARGVPLPLGAIHNRRSLVGIDNLVNLILTCIDNPAAANQVFLVSDGEDLSTTELLVRMGRALGKPTRLIPMPERLLTLGASMLGKPDIAQRLCGSLQVDITKTRGLLGWQPPVSVDEGLRRTAAHWLVTEGARK
jgi:nucleoside-diphosphate-sugar epimerase